MSCKHGIMAHRSDPKPEIAKSGSLKNEILWYCTVPDCTCHATLRPDVRPAPTTDQEDSAA